MAFILMLMVLIWVGGTYFKFSKGARMGAILAIYGVGILAHIALPDGNSLKAMFGQTWGHWTLVGIVVGGWILGRQALFFLRKLAARNAQEPTNQSPTFKEVEVDRYARHIFLREIGGAGQKKLKDAKVLVIGAGGLGAPALLYLAASGVGRIGVIDDDVVDNSNLQRQVIHKDAAIGMTKVFSAQKEMQAQNPFIDVRPFNKRLSKDLAGELFNDYDLILDGTDNFETRYMVNEVAVSLSKPLISAAMTQWEGQISIYDPANGAPCYQCVFPEIPAPGLIPSCAEAGVAGPLPGVLGSMMALETVKVITGAGADLRGALLIYDGLFAETRKISISRQENCPICGTKT